MQTKQDPREPVLLRDLKIMLHAKLCLIIFHICMCWHSERICKALSSWGQSGQVRLIECLNHTARFWLYRVPVLYFIMMHLVLTASCSLCTWDGIDYTYIPTPLGFTWWDTFKQGCGRAHVEHHFFDRHRKQGWYTPDLVSSPSSWFLDCHQRRSSPANFVLYGSGLGWSCVGSLHQSSEVGPGCYCFLGV